MIKYWACRFYRSKEDKIWPRSKKRMVWWVEGKTMELKFWGVRGSIPAPSPHTVKVGGNTTCIDLRLDDYLLVFDAGTGIRQLECYWRMKSCPVGRKMYFWHTITGVTFRDSLFSRLHSERRIVLSSMVNAREGSRSMNFSANRCNLPTFQSPLMLFRDL